MKNLEKNQDDEEESVICPLNMIIDDLMLISEQQVPVIDQKPIKRYYVNDTKQET